MGPFARRRGGIEAVLRDFEVDVLRRVVEELRELIRAEEPPEYTRRLFPPAYEHDEAAQQEYASMTAADLLESKKQALDSLERALDDAKRRRGGTVSVSLGDDDADVWLRVLNDARLTLGTRLDVTEDDYDRAVDPSDPLAAQREMYLWLGWLQGSLVETLMR
jgi:hypothetical protein